MKSAIKRLICICLAVLTMGILFACEITVDLPSEKEPPKQETTIGTFYTLTEAYDNGWLSRDDIMHISYYRKGKVMEGEPNSPESTWKEIDFTPKAEKPGIIPEKLEMDIKATYYVANKSIFDRDGYDEEEVLECLYISYYGQYNDSYVVKINCGLLNYPGDEPATYIAEIAWSESRPVMEVFRY